MSEDEVAPVEVVVGAALYRAFPTVGWGDARQRWEAAEALLEALYEDGWELARRPADEAATMTRWPLSFTCPRCKQAVHDPYDGGWCVVCKAHTGPLPKGLRR